jgi:Flp pilus assembly pilin Flp
MCAKNQIHEPFCVINADDFYGQEAFEKMAQFLSNDANATTFSMIGYLLGNTLSENGSVSRGVCQTDEHGNLVAINERTKIFKNEDGATAIEYGLIAALIAVAAITGMTSLGTSLGGRFNNVSNNLK